MNERRKQICFKGRALKINQVMKVIHYSKQLDVFTSAVGGINAPLFVFFTFTNQTLDPRQKQKIKTVKIPELMYECKSKMKTQ